MGIANALIKTMSICPPLGRSVLRRYLRAGGPVSARAEWIVDDLKRRLVPARPQRRIRLCDGLRLEIDLSSDIGRKIYYDGSCEPAVANFLTNTLQPGMTVIDAGANVGELALRSAARVGPSGRVLAVEASPITVQALRSNVALNRLSHLKVIHAAVSDQTCSLRFYLGGGAASGSSSLSPPHDFTGETVDVPGLTLDALAEQEGLSRVDCIKLDVEGAEAAALRGAEKLLTGDQPPILVFEFNPHVAQRAGWTMAQIVEQLQSKGYRVKALDESGVPCELEMDESRAHNLVALNP